MRKTKATKPPAQKQHRDLSARQRRFIDAYVLDPNAARAAITAGFAPTSARQTGSRLMTNADIRRAVDAGLARLHEQFEIAQGELLKAFRDIAFGDANQLVEYRRHCCRYCWGKDFRYQLTKGELRRANEIVKAKEENPADKTLTLPLEWRDHGGGGYDQRKDPHPQCPECWGEGIGEVFIQDTRNLSPQARQMFNGIEETENGVKVRLKSSDRALEVLARHKQLYVERVKVTYDPINTEELDAMYERGMQKAAERQAAIAGRAERLGIDLTSGTQK